MLVDAGIVRDGDFRLRLDGITPWRASQQSGCASRCYHTPCRRAPLPALAFEQSGRRGDVAGLAGCDPEPQGPTERVGEHVDFGGQSPSERPSAWSLPPLFRRRLLVSANDRAVDHQILVVPVRRQRLEHPLPDAGMAPATEASVHRLPLAVAVRKIAPMGTRAQHPQTSVTNRRLSAPVRPGSVVLPEPATQSVTIAPRSAHTA